ncbi:MAG: FAD-dependent oxidoreductase [Cytophagaceae bacterium]|jgi:protoporphyrinogen oxidase|nr:FAD-dependent oxidoreductase [Cytophagaceae bacterium]
MLRIAVIGAGPAGITAAYQLSKQHVLVELYEASSSVGGMAKTIELWDCKVDIGPHRFFSSDTRVNQLWLEVAGTDYEMVNRLTRIFYKKRFFFYPLKPFDALFNLGIWEAMHCMASYALQFFFPTKEMGDFETWVTSRFGKRLYQIFFKTYTEKLWGISCAELDADFAAQRIKKLSLFEAVKNAMLGGKKNKHKTLVDEFAYPKGGTGMVYERMHSIIEKNGGRVFLNTPVKSLKTKQGVAYGIELMDGTIREYDHIISSMPLNQLVLRMPEVPAHIADHARNLKFRNTVIVYLKVEGKDLFPDNWLYIHSTDLQTGRITNFRNWVPTLHGDTNFSILALEYWCYDQDAFWTKSDQELIQLATSDLKATGLIGKAAVSEGYIYKIPKCYPVYERGYKEHIKPVEAFVASIKNLQAIGRYGAFKYNNQDHSILMGLLAAENVLQNAQHDLWEINTDYENYQESSVITKTGLQKKS